MFRYDVICSKPNKVINIMILQLWVLYNILIFTLLREAQYTYYIIYRFQVYTVHNTYIQIIGKII